MKLRPEIEPNFDILELHHPKILDLILRYTDFIDEFGDEDESEYKSVESKLHNLTGKDISKFNLFEYWEEEGAEVLAFRIGLPDPVKIQDITKDELTEVVRRLKTFEEVDDKPEEEKTLREQFSYHIDDYYHNFLKTNLPKYQYKYFIRNKDKKGNYFEFSIEEIVEKLF